MIKNLYYLRIIQVFLLLVNSINPKKERNSLLSQRKAVLLQADYYHKRIRD